MTLGAKRRFRLDPDVAYFDSSGFGPLHEEVWQHQQRVRQEIERNPSHYMRCRLLEELPPVRARLAAFVGARPEQLCFVPNASIGVNTALCNLEPKPGDRILVLDIAYRGLDNAVKDYAERWSAEVARLALDFPLSDSTVALAAFERELERGIQYAVIEHVTSPSALVLPMADIARLLRANGVVTIIDGAGAPGLLPLDLSKIDCDFYIGNCHKWLGAPRPSAFLHVAAAWLEKVRGLVRTSLPTATSGGRSMGLRETEWMGAYDPSAYLSVDKAIDVMSQTCPGGWSGLWRRNQRGLLDGIDYLKQRLGIETLAGGPFVAAAAAVLLPRLEGRHARRLQDHLYRRGVVACCFDWRGRLAVRLGHHVFSEQLDYVRLAEAIDSLD